METYKDTISGETLYVSSDGVVTQYYKDKARKIRHRVDGPAIDFGPDGNKYWLQNNVYHRLDGPCAVYSHGEKFWRVNDVYITGINEDGEYEGPNWLQEQLDGINGV